eukprot:TRINITY_DN75956_c0_g1_i1.p1 TRINITY_DN75956_c0_g1~~TRINITY_DN75956_c0_g1_i1.p1  ORF type:complete len:302 (-),score=28.34 TRINITY_DN75956_c0_g1_i1:272-1177(-)
MAIFNNGRWMAEVMLSDVRDPDDTAPRTREPEPVLPVQIDGYACCEHLGTARSTSVYRLVKTREHSSSHEPWHECVLKVYSESSKTDFLLHLHFLRAVQGHQNVMALQWFDESVQRALVVPLYECDLNEHINGRALPSEGEMRHLTKGLVDALRHIHAREIVHRDVKPTHIAISRDASVGCVLMNFDFACHTWDKFQTQAAIGTAGYAAPEMLLNIGCSTKSDLFSLGCVLYFMLARQSPFDSFPFVENATLRMNALCTYEFTEPFNLVSNEFKTLINSLLMRSPASRLSAKEVLGHQWIA